MSDEENRDLDLLLNKHYRRFYKSIDDWANKSGYPFGIAPPVKISFRFFGHERAERLVKESFCSFFRKPLVLDRDKIQPRPGKSLSPKLVRSHATVQVSITAFYQWMQSDPRLAYFVRVTEPVSINERLAGHYARLAGVYKRRLEDSLAKQKAPRIKTRE